MEFLRVQLGKVNAWFDRQGETVRIIIFTVLVMIGLLSLTVGVNTKSRWLLLLGVLSLVPVVATTCQRSFELGYKSTTYVIEIFLGVVVVAALILSIF